MKKASALIIILCLVLCTGIFASCDLNLTTQTSQGLEFVSNGDGTCYVKSIGSCTDTNIVIPSKSPSGDRVTKIGDFAFSSNYELISVVIPNGVTHISKGAFWDCRKLEKVEIPNSVTEIGESAFCWCDSLTSVKIPNNVKIIGVSAFQNCRALTNITIPDGVQSICDGAFEGCQSLTSVTIPGSVTTIGFAAFRNCNNLKSVSFKNTEGWRCENSVGQMKISSADLANTSTAATYLTSTYNLATWYRD